MIPATRTARTTATLVTSARVAVNELLEAVDGAWRPGDQWCSLQVVLNVVGQFRGRAITLSAFLAHRFKRDPFQLFMEVFGKRCDFSPAAFSYLF